ERAEDGPSIVAEAAQIVGTDFSHDYPFNTAWYAFPAALRLSRSCLYRSTCDLKMGESVSPSAAIPAIIPAQYWSSVSAVSISLLSMTMVSACDSSVVLMMFPFSDSRAVAQGRVVYQVPFPRKARQPEAHL